MLFAITGHKTGDTAFCLTKQANTHQNIKQNTDLTVRIKMGIKGNKILKMSALVTLLLLNTTIHEKNHFCLHCSALA
jgi:hypothetical protein